jgi:hypothetical protein
MVKDLARTHCLFGAGYKSIVSCFLVAFSGIFGAISIVYSADTGIEGVVYDVQWSGYVTNLDDDVDAQCFGISTIGKNPNVALEAGRWAFRDAEIVCNGVLGACSRTLQQIIDQYGHGTYYSACSNPSKINYFNTFTGFINPTLAIENPNSANANRFVDIRKPTFATTTASTTVEIEIQFFSQAGFDFVELPPQKYGFDIIDAVTNELYYSFSQSLPANTNFNTVYSSTTIQVEGSKILTAYIKNSLNNLDLAVPQSVFYNVATNTYLAATGLEYPGAPGGNLSQNNCALFDVGCQFQRALIFLFVPTTSLNKFRDLWTTLISVPPFGYVTVTINQLKGVNASTTPAWNMPAIPFNDAIFSPFRLALAGILWGLFAFAFYRRLKNIEL